MKPKHHLLLHHSLVTLKYSPFRALAAFAFGAVSANATDYTWGGGDLNWTDTSASGWNGGPPSTGDNATINSGTVTLTENNQLNPLNSVTIGGTGKLTQTTGNTWSDFNSLTLNGGTLESTRSTGNAFGSYQLSNTVTVTGSTASTISTNGSGNIFINLGLAVNNSPTFTTFNVADVTSNTATDLTISTVLADNIAGDFASFSTAGLIKTGAGTMALTAANTYRGVTTLAGGVVNVGTFSDYGVAGGLGNRASDGSGDVGILFQGGTLQYTGATAQSTNRAIRINADGGGGNPGGATIDASGSDPSATLTFSRATSSPDFWANTGSRTLTLTGSNTGDNTFAHPIEDLSGLTTTNLVKSGEGKWVLTGTNNYSGTTTVSSGKLVINGNNSAATGAVTVASGATLGGTGTVGGTLSVTGILAPGDGGIESLDVTNTVTWKGAASAGAATIWQFELGASNTADLLNITGDFTKDDSAGTFFRFDFMNSNFNGTFKLVDWSNTTNFLASDFSYTNLGGGRTGSFSFNGSSLEFTAVPEPTSALAGLLITAGLLGRRRKF